MFPSFSRYSTLSLVGVPSGLGLCRNSRVYHAQVKQELCWLKEMEGEARSLEEHESFVEKAVQKFKKAAGFGTSGNDEEILNLATEDVKV